MYSREKKCRKLSCPFPRPLRLLYFSDVWRICYLIQCSLQRTEEEDNKYIWIDGFNVQQGNGRGWVTGNGWRLTFDSHSRKPLVEVIIKLLKSPFMSSKALQLIYASSIKETKSHIFIWTTSAVAVSNTDIGFIREGFRFNGRLNSLLSSLKFVVNCKTFGSPHTYRTQSNSTAWYIPTFTKCH